MATVTGLEAEFDRLSMLRVHSEALPTESEEHRAKLASARDGGSPTAGVRAKPLESATRTEIEPRAPRRAKTWLIN